MKTRAAMLWETGRDWEVVELDLDEPKQGEVLIRWVAAGLCHSDEHLRHGDIVPRFPIVGGHEGAGVIEKVGPGVSRRQGGRPRRHARSCPCAGTAASAPPGTRTSATSGATILDGCLPDGTFRFHANGDDVGAHVHARLLQPVLDDLRDELRLGRQGPAAGHGRARRLRRPDRLVLRRLRRRRRAGRDRDHLRHRRHRRQRRPGRGARRRGQRDRRRPAGQQARDGRGPRRHAHRRERRGGPRARAGAHPRRRRRQGDHHRRHRQRGGRRRGRQRDPQGRHGGHHRPRRPEQAHRPALAARS